MKKKIAQTKSPFKKEQIRKDYEELRKAQTSLEELEGLPAGTDANDILEKVVNENVNVLPENQKAQRQLDQMIEFITNHKDITDPNAKAKLDKVLAGEKVKDNGIDYNAEVDKIIQRNLDTRGFEQKTKDITEIIAEMEAKEQQPTAPVKPETSE